MLTVTVGDFTNGGYPLRADGWRNVGRLEWNGRRWKAVVYRNGRAITRCNFLAKEGALADAAEILGAHF